MIRTTKQFRKLPRRTLALVGSGSILLLAGCHSAFVNATITNTSGRPLRLVEIDYPSASFGTNDLAPGGTFKYRFKVLGSGPATLLWTGADGKEHKSEGPSLEEGEEGSLAAKVGQEDAQWVSHLHH